MAAYSSQYVNFMAAYRIPMILGNNYFRLMIGLGNITTTLKQVNTLSEQLRTLAGTNTAILTIFDRSINHPAYYPPFKANSVNKNITYDQT